MSAFSFVRHVKASRKACRCGQCNRMIEIGHPKVVLSGNWDGDFYSSSEHPECRDAADAYYASSSWPDAEIRPILMNDMDGRGDSDWLRRKHPVVAERLGITPQAAP